MGKHLFYRGRYFNNAIVNELKENKMDHARMNELDEQFNDSYCEHCKRECESKTVCGSCGEPPEGEDIDMQYCRHCKDHATFIEACEFCGGEVTKDGRVEAVVSPDFWRTFTRKLTEEYAKISKLDDENSILVKKMLEPFIDALIKTEQEINS